MKKQNWIVRMECVVVKDVYVENCTEEEARQKPFEHATHAKEAEVTDWKVKAVRPNED